MSILRRRHALPFILLATSGVLSWAGCSEDFTTASGRGSGGGAGEGGSGGLSSTGGTGIAGGGPHGGAGGDGPSCPDADEDGHSTCDGDCDDGDKTSFPGNREICGDLVDNDCNEGADDICEGLGTFVSAKIGADTNPGTMEEPVATLAKGIANAAALGGDLTVYVADAVYAEDPIDLVESVSLEGGYHCDETACDWSRDADACLTILRPESPRGVLADETITSVTRLDGFKIEGKAGAAAGAGVQAGRAALTLDGGTPVVTNNCIHAPDVSSGAYPAGRSLGVNIVAPLNDADGVTLENNRITGGASAAAWSEAVLIEPETDGQVGKVTLRRNRILGGSGPAVLGISSKATAPGSVFEQNEVSGGAATAWTWAVRLEKGAVTLDANRLNADISHPTVNTSAETSGTTWAGGIAVLNASAILTNNVVYGAKSEYSTALLIFPTTANVAEVVVSSNTLFGGSIDDATPPVRATAFAIFRATANPTTARGRLRNNIFVAQNGSAVRRAGWEVNLTGTSGYGAMQPEVFENNILRLNPQGIANQYLYTEFSVNHATIDTVNAMDPGTMARGNNLATDPKLDATAHVGLGSLARDNGTPDDAPDHDIDGDARPLGEGFDIGADESE